MRFNSFYMKILYITLVILLLMVTIFIIVRYLQVAKKLKDINRERNILLTDWVIVIDVEDINKPIARHCKIIRTQLDQLRYEVHVTALDRDDIAVWRSDLNNYFFESQLPILDGYIKVMVE